MIAKRKVFLILICLPILGCSSADNSTKKQAANQKPVTLSQADSGGKFDLATGQSLEIELAENPTTGYRWRPEVIQTVLDFAAGLIARIPEHVRCERGPKEEGES